MKQRNETFGRLLKAGIASIANCEGKTAAVVEDALGQVIGVSGDTIQRYKSGAVPPDPRTIQLLAEAAVQRGFLGREWLHRFLHAARYPQADHLLDRLCPAPQVRPRPPRIYENLPAPTYSQFVMRAQAFAEVLDGLQQRSAIVLIVGMGGNGKTSLAREVASHCLREDGAGGMRFDAAVWVSDKDQPGTTNLSLVLDGIARTLDYPGFTQFEHSEKQHEVEQLLRRQRVLLIVDNFETITDGALLAWLLRLPEPSKALVTSREYSRAFRNSTIVAELRGMTALEVQTLIEHRLRILRIEHLVASLEYLEPLIIATGGNPKAIQLTLGLVKYERRSLQQVVDDLYAARGEIFVDLFARAWALLDEAARRVLMVATFFPTSASGEALSASADVQGFAFDRAVERLSDMALIDVQQTDLNSPLRYALHPLVRAFAQAQLNTQDTASYRHQWKAFFLHFVSMNIGDAWISGDELDRLEQEVENIHEVMRYCHDLQFLQHILDLAHALGPYWSYRGHYAESEYFKLIAIKAAKNAGDVNSQVEFLCSYARSLAYRDQLDEAIVYSEQARDLLPHINSESIRVKRTITVNYSAGRVCLLSGNHEYLRTLIRESLSLVQSEQHRILVQYDMVELLLADKQYAEAEALCISLAQRSLEIDDYRGPIRGWMLLARLAIMRDAPTLAADFLQKAEVRACAIKHRRNMASIYALWGRLHTLRGDIPAARAALIEAIDLFERMGMRRELVEARQALRELESEPATSDA